MIITIDKESIIENITENVNSKIDILLNKEKLEPSDYYLTKNHRTWIDRQLIFGDYQVRRIILHMLDQLADECKVSEQITYTIKITHPMQPTYIPPLIEELLIDYVSDMWMTERGVLSSPKSVISSINLQRASHLSSTARKIPYRLI